MCPLRKRKRNLIEKEHCFVLTSLQVQHWKNKDNEFLCQLCFLRLYLFWLPPCSFDFSYLWMHITIMNWRKCYVISTLQISAMLDYHKDCFRRICKGIKIYKNGRLYLGSGSHGDRLTWLFGGHKGFFNAQWLLTSCYFTGCNCI